MRTDPRIAFVTDTLPSIGGGEKTLFAALEVFPNAELFTLIYNKPVFMNTPIAKYRVITSYLNSLPFARQYHRFFLPFMPSAMERLDLRGYDIVVSFSYAVAHGVNVPSTTRHLTYMYTPMRYAWRNLNLHGKQTGKNILMDLLLQRFRNWDISVSTRVDEFTAISKAIADRIEQAYHRHANIIYPPVEVERFRPSRERGNYYITVSRLVAHKRIDLMVDAFSNLDLPLVIVGDGPERNHLEGKAADNIRFTGYQSDEQIAELLGKARGFVCAAEEDFGIAIVEAQAAGCPVIAYGKGGVLETTIDGMTGTFFPEQTTSNLIDAIQRFESRLEPFDTDKLVQNAKKFGRARFQQEFHKFVVCEA